MRVNFTARHYKPSERLKEYATQEVQKLERYYDSIIDCEIILDYQKLHQIADIKLIVHGNTLAAIEKSDDIYKSIDLAVTKLERQLKKYKAKMSHFTNEKIINNITENVL
ncbi:ribosome-associated translation inhibitor RaiA [candidate division KSB1 bacterium]|nr:ribosome-associated translation inhibitor RaiA [candidate division KSB1 bacterium]